MLTVQIDTQALADEGARAGATARRVLDEAKVTLRVGALETVARVKEEMPVDTGRARASWGDAMREGTWEIADDGTAITQGSNVNYVGRLNEGWSQQAPAGFIDAAAEAAGDTLEEQLGAMMEGLL